MTPVSDAALHPTPEDWRILRALSLYRLLLVTLLLVLFESGFSPYFFLEMHSGRFYRTCIGYAMAALLLLLPVLYRNPRISIQSHIHFSVDAVAITLLVYASGGVSNGLGMLLFTPAVGCSLVLPPRMAIVQAAGATLLLFGEEVLRQYKLGFVPSDFTTTGILGLMFFATSSTANAVAQRARKSEALVERVGSDLANLARLNERIIAHMQAGVVVVAEDSRIHMLNTAARRMLHTPPGSTGTKLTECAPGLATALQAWLAGGTREAEPMVPRPGADEVIPRFSRLGTGPVAPILILIESAREMREQAQQMKLASLGQLSASIAHEIRNPLSAISHASQLLAESGDVSGENQRLLLMIQRHSGRIDKIVKDVLSLSKQKSATRNPIRLKAWLAQAVVQYQEGYAAKTRSIEMDGIGDDFFVSFDPNHLQQVLYNLWDNSFDHSGRDGRMVHVVLRTGREGRKSAPHLDISDNGPGIPAAVLDHIFEPFFTTAHAGTGLGLYLARELCEYNQARLSYVTQPSGACFRLTFAATQET